jgi:ATP/ADP translocase/HEAT repeat protein
MPMLDIIQRIFKIHKGEGGKVLLFALLAIILQAGVALGLSIADTLFLTNVGSEKLPIVYIFMPVIMLFLTPVFSYLINRLGIDRLFNLVLSILVACGFIFVLLLYTAKGATSIRLVSYLVKFYASLWLIYLYTLYWNFIDGYFDILDAKRLFSFFSGGMSVGAMLGGVLVTLFISFLKVEQLFVVWSVLALVTFPLVFLLRRKYKKIEVEEEYEEESGFWERMKQIAITCKNSRYVIMLILLAFGMLFLTTTCEFQYLGIFSDFKKASPIFSNVEGNVVKELFRKPGSPEELASLFGKLFAVVNLFNLIVNLFLFSRIVMFLGVRNTVLVQPIVYLITFSFLKINNGYEAALLGFLAYQGIQVSIDFNNNNFILNAVPSEIKKEIRTFMEGLFEPLATSMAGLFLLIGTSQKLSQQSISTIGIWVSVYTIIIVFLLRRDYVAAMITNLKKGWLDFSKSDEEILKGLDANELQVLAESIKDRDNETAYTAIRILWLNDKFMALNSILMLLSHASEEEQKIFKPLFAEMLEGEDDEVIRRLLQWLESEDVSLGPSLIEELGSHSLIQPQSFSPILESSSPDERAAAVVALWSSWNLNDGLQAMEAAGSLLKGDKSELIAAIRALSRMEQERFSHLLVPYLNNPSNEIRREALTAIYKLVNQDSSRLIPYILWAIENGDSEERIVGMNALTKIADSRCIIPLLSISESFTSFERRKTAQVILSIGQRSVPAVVSVFRDAQYPYVARSIAARSLGKLLFPQFEALFPEIIQIEIERAYRFLYYHMVLEQSNASSPGILVLSRFYLDFQRTIIESVLEILTIGGRLPDYELISSSLNSPNLKARGNAIETIEQACTRKMFKILLPLVDSRSLEDKVRFYTNNFSYEKLTIEEIVSNALQSTFALECSAAAQAMYDISGASSFETLRKKIHQSPTPLFKDTVNSLFARESNVIPSFYSELALNETKEQVLEQSEEAETRLNTVEKLYYLSKAAFFKPFGTLELQTIAEGSTEAFFETAENVYKHGETADSLFLILDGAVQLEKDNKKLIKHAGETFGENCLFGEVLRLEDAIAESLKVLVLHKEKIISDAETYPKIALGLLENKLLNRGSKYAIRS